VALIALDILRSFAVLRFETRIGVAMQAALVDRVVSAPARFFRDFSSGDLALRMGSVNTVQRTLTGSTIETFVTSLFLFANLGLMIAYSPALTLAASGIVILVIAVTVALGFLRLKIGPRIEALDGRLSAMTFEIFAGISKLRAAAAEPRVLHALVRALRRVPCRQPRERRAQQLRDRGAVAAAAGRHDPGAVPGVAARGAKCHAPVHRQLRRLPRRALRPAGGRARAGVDFARGGEPEAGVGSGPAHPGDAARGCRRRPRAPPAHRRHRARQRGLRLSQRAARAATRRPHDPRRRARRHRGPSGSGKSTLLRLLLGFEAPATGKISYDGHDLATLDLRHLRARLGTVLQGGKLWAGDLRTNILAPPTSMWRPRGEQPASGLAAEIEAMPMGLYTVVGEGLSTISGGQRQRVLLARALVGDPAILLLDEATSALDNVSQATVLGELAKLKATRLVIAHRLSTVRDADRIVVSMPGASCSKGPSKNSRSSATVCSPRCSRGRKLGTPPATRRCAALASAPTTAPKRFAATVLLVLLLLDAHGLDAGARVSGFSRDAVTVMVSICTTLGSGGRRLASTTIVPIFLTSWPPETPSSCSSDSSPCFLSFWDMLLPPTVVDRCEANLSRTLPPSAEFSARATPNLHAPTWFTPGRAGG
jgi:ATP-binding cassette subfamily C protein